MKRQVREDRESYKFWDESGKLVMLLSFQQTFEQVKKRKPHGHGEGHANAVGHNRLLEIGL